MRKSSICRILCVMNSAGVLLRTVTRFQKELYRIGGNLAPVPRLVNPANPLSKEFVRPGIVSADDFASGKLRACSLYGEPVWGGAHTVWRTTSTFIMHSGTLEFRCDAHPVAPTLYRVVPSRPMPYKDYLLAVNDMKQWFDSCTEDKIREEYWKLSKLIPELPDPSLNHRKLHLKRWVRRFGSQEIRDLLWWRCQDWYKDRVTVSLPVEDNDFPLMESVIRCIGSHPEHIFDRCSVTDLIDPDKSFLFPRSTPGTAALLAHVVPFIRAAASTLYKEFVARQESTLPLQDIEHPDAYAFERERAKRTEAATEYRELMEYFLTDSEKAGTPST